MVASNTKECFRHCVGKRVIGVLFDALPVRCADLSAGNKTLVFDDGGGLTISDTGTFWIESADEIARAVERRREELNATKGEIAEVIALAGAHPRSKLRRNARA